MPAPRSHIVDPEVPGFYHCVSRCVRRAFLCGFDAVLGRDCSHRKTWIEQRLVELAGLFALNVYAYAVMSNHLHVVVQLDPDAARTWASEDVADRWVRLFPVRLRGEPDAEANDRRRAALLADPTRIAECRRRLASLSWFMRCLKEPLARLANREDCVTGRFWEGRYTCQALLDETALLACMAYVELNPVRAGIAQDLPSSEHTSLTARIANVAAAPEAPLARVAGCVPEAVLSLDAGQYLQLVDWTGRQVHEGKRGVIRDTAPPILARLDIDAAAWRRDALGINCYHRAVGRAEALVHKARALGQAWLWGFRAPKVTSG